MVANHPGMSDQTNSNIARDGAAKHPQTSFPIKEGMKDQTTITSGPSSPGIGPDASSPNPLDPSPKLKKFGEVATKWGMKGEHSPELGRRVLAEAANLGR